MTDKARRGLQDFDPVAYINEPRWRNSSLGLDRVRLMMHELGDPHDGLRFVHVAGTNGKGSVCAYLASILQCSGMRTGLFTSPYIEHFEERIRVDGQDISADSLLWATLVVRDAAEKVEMQTGEHPTEFELMFAVAMMHFARQRCDMVVLEVGLGGRLDATNVVNPKLCVVSRIGYDHTGILGTTLGEIAAEKAGIVKAGVPVVSWPQEGEAAEAIARACERTGAPLSVVDFNQLRTGSVDIDAGIRSFSYRGYDYESGLLASYQPANAALAIDSAMLLGISQEAIAKGVLEAKWPGRFEIIGKKPFVAVDGAHNPQGAAALAHTLDEFGLSNVTFVVGVLADKDYAGVIRPLARLAKRFVCYAPSNPRALSACALASAISATMPSVPIDTAPNAGDAITLALQEESPEGSIVAFGTLYSIGEVKRAFAESGTR